MKDNEPKTKKPTRRVTMFARRHVRLLDRAFAILDKANEALVLARQNGLKTGDVVEAQRFNKSGVKELIPFELIDNRLEMEVKGKIYRPARVPLFELREIPRTRREKKIDPQLASTAEIGV